ncbi:growth/differentiation factor 8-like [Melanaphis sacchari]|uniref:growth/differentiation factor 8-like n=1 Tax=Melanaphis sacchari TaxID=742174 RepID=UPI000DC14E29|nr:growth/differentiation factor 8-like [Melanaphis sacchari]
MPHTVVVVVFAIILFLVPGQTLLTTTVAADRQQDFDSGDGDGGMKSLAIELIKLSILNKLGMQQPPEFGDRRLLQVQLQKYHNNSGSSTVTAPQFQNRLHHLNATRNNTINVNNYNDYDDNYHAQTQKLIAFAQPHPTTQNLQGQYPLYFAFSDQTRHYRITKAILWVYKRMLDVVIDNSVIIINVYKINPRNLQQSLVSSVEQVFNTTKPGWVPIELQRNMSDWFKTMDGAKNLTLVVQAYYINKNTTYDKMPYITNARKREDNMTETPYLEVHTHYGYRNRREARYESSTCNDTTCTSQTRCSRYPVMIDFNNIGWNWILAPKKFKFYYCLGDNMSTGECSSSIPAHSSRPTSEQELQISVKGRCCVPHKTSKFTLFYMDSLGNISLSVIPNMVVDECR